MAKIERGVQRDATITVYSFAAPEQKIRDAVPDPKGRYLYLLGRRVHVYSGDGESELRTIPIDDPMAVAVSSIGVGVLAGELISRVSAEVGIARLPV